ncbi:MAG: hypothetical protein MO846_08290 [Candidatus Devosia symbiotica]|nr:hypothetical protein [Candidatus Devosia symbiotica]
MASFTIKVVLQGSWYMLIWRKKTIMAAARLAGRKIVRELEGAVMLAHETGDTDHISEVVSEILQHIDQVAGGNSHD